MSLLLLHSDTATLPSPGMLVAITEAELGDEQMGTDPTVNRLEARAAELLGKDCAVFVPTATMANHIAFGVLGQPGDELLAEETSHVLTAESGGAARHGGLSVRSLPGVNGRLGAQQIIDAVRGRPRTPLNFTRPTVVSLENTHNAAGGRVWQPAELAAVAECAHEFDLSVHLDGARLMNASVAAGADPSAFARSVDTVTVCFSKGLGCPLGAVIVGSEEQMHRARRLKFAFGGAMRQAGVVAAAALYALDHNIERLADDHARARRLGEGLRDGGLTVDLDRIESNMVQIDVGPLGLGSEEAQSRVREAGIALAKTVHPNVLRAVTHLDISDRDIEHAIETIPVALRLEVALKSG